MFMFIKERERGDGEEDKKSQGPLEYDRSGVKMPSMKGILLFFLLIILQRISQETGYCNCLSSRGK